ncbi:MAG: glycyl radical protein [Thermodesulfobacteriota bacterium]|nr:glycyl radical protein [Thermodesulfobacteriota bacterium]
MAIRVDESRVDESPGITLPERAKKLKERYLTATPQVCAERAHLFTQYWRQSEGEPIYIRRAKAFRHVLERMSVCICEHELIVGSQTKYSRGASPYLEFKHRWLRDELHKLSEREGIRFNITEQDRKSLLEDADFWDGRSLEDVTVPIKLEKWGRRYQVAVESRLTTDNSIRPVGRITVDYPRVLREGLNGAIGEAKTKLAGLVIDSAEAVRHKFFLEAVIIACEAVIAFAKRYSQLAKELAEKETDIQRKSELLQICDICDWVPANPPRTFHEALQCFWFIHLAVEIEQNAPGYSPARFDQYMYPFYKKDIEEGRLTRDEAAELLCCLWVKFQEITSLEDAGLEVRNSGNLFQNITIGGQTPEGKDATNELSYLILDVTGALKLMQPTISLRYHDGLPEDFLLKAAELVSTGGGMPAFFNDKYALAVLPYYGVPKEEARNWTPVGCVEMNIPHCTSPMSSSGWYSLPKILELTLNNGIDPLSGFQLGPATGDPRQFRNFEELFGAFKKQVIAVFELVNVFHLLGFAFHPLLVPLPFISALMNDCIKKGKDITEGGARYLNMAAPSPVGFCSAANPLTAIKKLVFEDKTVEMGKLLDALAANCEGYDELRKKLLDAPKYGNNDDYADTVMNRVFQLWNELVFQYPNRWGAPQAPKYLGITAHYFYGKTVGATPDGRLAYTPFSDGSLSPYPGTDRKGPTAVIKSASSIDVNPTLCTLLNQKFHPAAIRGKGGLRKLLALVKTYFDLNGYHIQFNVVDRETLLDAKKHPEKHRDLVVRVAGFSAHFVELAPMIQDEIISRTEQTF